MTLRKLGSRLQGHPHSLALPGLEASTGSLGQGLSIAIGCALAIKLNKKNNRVYCLMGDGEQQEGQIWEAAMSAAHYKLDNLCGIVDRNRLQIDGFCKEVMNTEPLEKKWESFGWHVINVDGHDIPALINAFEEAKTIKGKPTVIIADTIKGKGVSFMENVAIWHGQAPNNEETKKALNDLGEYH
jgi:transketolase